VEGLLISGFVLTPRTLTARVRLTSEQTSLWGQPDAVTLTPEQQQLCDAVEDVGLDATDAGSYFTPEDFKAEPCDVGGETSLVYVDAETPLDVAQRAHVTLGLAEGVKPVVSGFDILDVCRREAKWKQQLKSRAEEEEGETAISSTTIEVVENLPNGNVPHGDVSNEAETSGGSCDVAPRRSVVEGNSVVEYGGGVVVVELSRWIRVDALFAPVFNS